MLDASCLVSTLHALRLPTPDPPLPDPPSPPAPLSPDPLPVASGAGVPLVAAEAEELGWEEPPDADGLEAVPPHALSRTVADSAPAISAGTSSRGRRARGVMAASQHCAGRARPPGADRWHESARH